MSLKESIQPWYDYFDQLSVRMTTGMHGSIHQVITQGCVRQYRSYNTEGAKQGNVWGPDLSVVGFEYLTLPMILK